MVFAGLAGMEFIVLTEDWMTGESAYLFVLCGVGKTFIEIFFIFIIGTKKSAAQLISLQFYEINGSWLLYYRNIGTSHHYNHSW